MASSALETACAYFRKNEPGRHWRTSANAMPTVDAVTNDSSGRYIEFRFAITPDLAEPVEISLTISREDFALVFEKMFRVGGK